MANSGKFWGLDDRFLTRDSYLGHGARPAPGGAVGPVIVRLGGSIGAGSSPRNEAGRRAQWGPFRC